jgi:hypothetical protein
MYKSKDTGKCEFCPSSTYSDGTLIECLKCDGDLSVLPGLYYKNWNELPTYLKRSYISFDDTKDCMYKFFLFIYLINFFSLFKLKELFIVKVGFVFVDQYIFILTV